MDSRLFTQPLAKCRRWITESRFGKTIIGAFIGSVLLSLQSLPLSAQESPVLALTPSEKDALVQLASQITTGDLRAIDQDETHLIPEKIKAAIDLYIQTVDPQNQISWVINTSATVQKDRIGLVPITISINEDGDTTKRGRYLHLHYDPKLNDSEPITLVFEQVPSDNLVRFLSLFGGKIKISVRQGSDAPSTRASNPAIQFILKPNMLSGKVTGLNHSGNPGTRGTVWFETLAF
jgi:hypothetical protein